MEEVLASATKSGMYLVDDSNTKALEKEYEEGIVTADKFCEIQDPESTPFNSKYEARKILDNLCNKLEATKTIASLEKKRDVIKLMNCLIASVRVRLGTIAWECEEPHNAQVDLENAADYYFPGFISDVIILVGTDSEQDLKEGITSHVPYLLQLDSDATKKNIYDSYSDHYKKDNDIDNNYYSNDSNINHDYFNKYTL
jgi:hypothetical protein